MSSDNACVLSRFHGTYKCPFGSTAVRTAPLIKRDEMMFPGPAHYQQRPSTAKGGGTTADGEKTRGGGQVSDEKPSYTFASTTSRLYSPPSIVTVRANYDPNQCDMYMCMYDRYSQGIVLYTCENLLYTCTTPHIHDSVHVHVQWNSLFRTPSNDTFICTCSCTI